MKESPVAEAGKEASGQTNDSLERLAGANLEEEAVPLLWSPACPEIVEEPDSTIDWLPLSPPVAATDRDESNDVYVAVGTKESSLDVLRWALREAVIPGSCVYLVHVHSHVTFIPTPRADRYGDRRKLHGCQGYCGRHWFLHCEEDDNGDDKMAGSPRSQLCPDSVSTQHHAPQTLTK